MDIVYVYQKKRKEFGRQCKFVDRPAELMIDVHPDPALRADYIRRNPCETAVQHSREFSEHEVNTERYETDNRGINHTEGGWPKDVDVNEVEQVIRYRKKVEKDEHYMECIVRLGALAEQYIKQNNSVDIYEDYFQDMDDLREVIESPNAKTVNVFRDPKALKRTPASISWYPDGAKKIAAAYSILEFQKADLATTMESYIWDIENPSEPEMSLLPSSPLVSLAYNPKDVHVLIGGCYNGQITIWDTRRGSRPTETSPIEKSHRDPVHCAIFLQSKTGTECFSTSTDGQVLWWDIRNMTEPTETLSLDTDKSGKLHGGLVLDYESTMPTKFMVGTEQGTVLGGNRKAKNPGEKIVAVYQAHNGPVNALQRNPFYPKYFLSVGDWTARVWSEDIKESPIMWTKPHNSYLTHGCWSSTRPGVFLTAKSDGSVDVWDLLFKQNEPCLSMQVADMPISYLSVQESGAYVACGCKDGSITLLELGSTLSVMQPGEKATISNMFERESAREKLYISRMRELTLSRKSAAKSQSMQGGSSNGDDSDPIASAEKAFFEILEAEKLKIEKLKAKQTEAAAEMAAAAAATQA